MSALSASRNTQELAGGQKIVRSFKVASGATLYVGGIGAINSSNEAVPASDTAGLVAMGRVEAVYEKSNGDVWVDLKSGIFSFDVGTSGEALTAASTNNLVYIVDDHTLGAVGGTNHIKGAVLRWVDPAGLFWFEIGNIRTT